jgi:methylase of polypeptide subunit release factors
MLPLDAPPEEVARYGARLRELAKRHPLVLETLFDPLQPRVKVSAPKELGDELRALGLLLEVDGDLYAVHRIRRRGDRFYAMEIGADDGSDFEYHQDVWPETDAILEVLDATAAQGSVLDMGTGTGIVAIEAAVRGHRVVATDIFPSALALARFNALLNGVADRIEFRRGHLFEPAGEERFDLILTAPHYTRTGDQLRLEALRTGPKQIAPGGRLVVATFFEWEEGDAERIPAVEVMLAPLVARGMSVTVEPIVRELKRDWFKRALSDPPVPRLVSRHRFLVTITPPPAQAGTLATGALHVRRPVPGEQMAALHVPLERLRLGEQAGPWRAGRAPVAVLGGPRDLARADELLDALGGGLVVLSGAIPGDLLDACRIGANKCVVPGETAGAAGAILDLEGGVRPCTHGQPIVGADASLLALMNRQRELAEEAYERRGCATCSALAVCSRCLFAGPLEEVGYCEWMRARSERLPLLHRLFDTLRHLDRSGPLTATIKIKTRRAAALIAAEGRPLPVAESAEDWVAEQLVKALRQRWRERETWLVGQERRFSLFWRREGRLFSSSVNDVTAELGELIADGATHGELVAYRESRHFEELVEAKVFRQLTDLWQ